MIQLVTSPGHISIHALREEGDERAAGMGKACAISIHALREEGDVQRQYVHEELRDFYPRPPRGGRHAATPDLEYILQFLSTPSARRATRHADNRGLVNAISIHALREEGDAVAVCRQLLTEYFYPRPPRGGRHMGIFRNRCCSVYFYPRPPRGGRPKLMQELTKTYKISIHALREEGDFHLDIAGKRLFPISIHALREEGDTIG